MASLNLRVGTRQIVKVYGALGWRMDWQVERVKPDGVELSLEAGYPTWWGGPSGMNRLTWHACDFGTQLVFRTRLSSLLPFTREVRVTPARAPDGGADLRFDLPRGWTAAVEELPDDDVA